MCIKEWLVITVLGFISGSLYAADSLYYTPQGTIKGQVGEGIEYTQHCVDICMHDFAALEISENLETIRARGVRIRVVILKRDNSNPMGSLAETLIQKGFDTRVLKPQSGGEQHQDFIILDDRVLVTGVYNWMAYRDRNICNDILFHYDQDRMCAYKNMFYRLFAEGEATPFLRNQKELIVSGHPQLSDMVSDGAGQTVQGIALDKKQAAAKELTEPIAEVVLRDFIDISIEEMNKQFGKESALSRSEKNELWKKYKGKYVRWHGLVAYKGMGRVDWNHIGVIRQHGQDAEAEILFDWRMFEKVMNVRVGSTITYTGRLVSRPGLKAPYRLDDGDIE